MSAISPRPRARSPSARPADDPRVVRSRAAAVEAARMLFLRRGYGGTTMEEIAARAGVTRRTLYNLYTDKETLFRRIVADVTAFADGFVETLRDELAAGGPARLLRPRLHDLGRRLALGIVRPEVVQVRRLLIGESRSFPSLAAEYFERAPAQVIAALAAGFRCLGNRGLLRVTDPRRAAAQFAYLVAGEPLDRAVLTGTVPPKREVVAGARAGVETFLARYGSGARTSGRRLDRPPSSAGGPAGAGAIRRR